MRQYEQVVVLKGIGYEVIRLLVPCYMDENYDDAIVGEFDVYYLARRIRSFDNVQTFRNFEDCFNWCYSRMAHQFEAKLEDGLNTDFLQDDSRKLFDLARQYGLTA